MKKDPSDYTPGEAKYAARQQAVKAGKPNAAIYFKNVAVTMAGDLCIGMTHNKTWSYYSCTYTQAGGVRDFAGSRSWSLSGVSNDGFSDLDLSTVSLGVRII